MMRLIVVFLLGLLVFFNYELWVDTNGHKRIAELELKVKQQVERNKAASTRNNAMAAEVKDLREGGQAVEELARFDQGMLKEGEIFVQIITP